MAKKHNNIPANIHLQHLTALLKAVPDLIFIMDREGKYLDFRGGKGAVFIPQNNMVGTYIQDSNLPKNVVEQVISHIQKAIDYDEINVLQYNITFEDGSIHYYESRASKYEENIALRIVREITEEILAQKKMQKLNEDIILQNQSLIQYNHIVSHYLRGPVATILGILNLFEMGFFSEAERDNLIDAIKKQATKLENTIKDLNDILSNNQLIQETKTELDITQEFLLTMGLFQEKINTSGAKITFNFYNAPSIYTIKSFMQSILENLLSNALKFRNPTKKLQIHVESFVNKNTQTIGFFMKDNGLGIDLQKYKDDIFNLYKRFHPHIEGKGISLYLIKTLLEMIGGAIYVENVESGGAMFVISIPDKSVVI